MTQSKEDKPYKKSLDSAWEEFGKGNNEKAKEIANKVIETYPDAIGSLVLLAHIDFEKNNFEAAVDKFKQCLKLDTEESNHGYFYYWMARVYEYDDFSTENKIKDAERASELYEKALKHKNYPPDVYFRLLRKKDGFSLKISFLKKGIEDFPEFTSFYIRLYSFSDKLNNHELIEILKTGYEKTSNYTIEFLIGKYYEENKGYPKAIKHYNHAIEKASDSDKHSFYFSLASAYYKNVDFKNAINSLSEVISNDSKAFHLISCLFSALIHFEENNKDLALDSINKIQLDENFFHTDLNDLMVWLENEYPTELYHSIDFNNLTNYLKELRKEVKREGNEILEYTYVLILKHNGKHYDRLRCLKSLVNEYSQDFLIEEYVDSYSDYLDILIEKGKSIENFLKLLVSDLENNYSFKNQFVKSYSASILFKHFFSTKEYERVLFLGKLFDKDEITKIDVWFEIAYSHGELDDANSAERAYKNELEKHPKSSASNNNLAIILEKKGLLEEALQYLNEARKIEPDKELYERNFLRVKEQLNELKTKENEYQAAIKFLENETDFAITRLTNFINNAKTDKNFDNYKLPIANWMFPKLMGTNKDLSNSLREQWLNKSYIFKTEFQDEHNVFYYEINPFIEKALLKQSFCKIDEKWTNGITQLSKELLEEINYSDNLLALSKISKLYREPIIRDYKELTINYFLNNEKATVILAGSLTEYLLTYYCAKKKIKTISYHSPKGKTITRKLYDCVLDDLIKYFEENNILKSDFYHLNNLARIYRNYVHPGRELKDADGLNMNKAKICFLGVSELLKMIL
jgi:tetratricopeptide (TPR) repeat protein